MNKLKNKFVKIISLNVCFAIFLASIAPIAKSQTKPPLIVEGIETVAAPIQASVKPAATIKGLSVKIGGATETDGKRFDVKITVTPPQGAPVSLNAKIDA